MMNKAHTHHRQAQSGSSLIEVLVALVILAVGMLSMAALHNASTKYGRLAEFRTSATMLAEELSDRMRANPAGVRNGNYVLNASWVAVPARVNEPGIPPACAAAQCAAAVAASDLAQWNNAAISVLPGAGLFTQQVGANSTVMDVWVAWIEPRGRGGADAAAENAINAAYTCPPGMNAPADVRCMYFRFTV
jgi:type IV pilus assembly protein PilV